MQTLVHQADLLGAGRMAALPAAGDVEEAARNDRSSSDSTAAARDGQ